MLAILKDIPTVSNYVIIWLLFYGWFVYRKKNFRIWWCYVGVVFILVGSTSYVPKRLIKTIEDAYRPINLSELNKDQSFYILVLGSGSTSDAHLPPNMNMTSTALVRLAEAIRIVNECPKATLVTSASPKLPELKSQAQMAKETAMVLGVESTRIKTLDTPKTTLEEAKAFKKRFGLNTNLILVTSALHMPRALKIFKDQGLAPLPAPTDYVYKKDPGSYNGFTLPRLSSLGLTDRWQRTVLKSLYYQLLVKT